MKETNIIGLAGRARSGKDTVGSYLLTKLPNSVTVSYAHPLKKEASTILGISIELVDYHKNNNIPYLGINIRKLLQSIADTNREEDDLYYIKKMNSTIANYVEQGYNNIIITDLRFILEADELRRANGKYATIVKIVRKDVRITESKHASEEEVDSIRPDYTIHNDKTLDDLCNRVDVILNNM